MFFQDLSPYSYLRLQVRENLVNVGWLDKGYPFTQDDPSEDLLERVWEFSRIAVAQTRGFQTCNLCDLPQSEMPQIERGTNRLRVGSAEIRVVGANKIYAAPNLLYHYISAHSDAPPEEFVRAVIEGPSPASEEYVRTLAELKISWKALDLFPCL